MQKFKHESPKAAQFLAFKRPVEKLHELCLKRSDRDLNVNLVAERAAHKAAAKLVQRTGRYITDVWTEDGTDFHLGKYRVWYVVTCPISGGSNDLIH